MTRNTCLFLTVSIVLLLTITACSLQGLPYPTDTPDPKLITPDFSHDRTYPGTFTDRDYFPNPQPDP